MIRISMITIGVYGFDGASFLARLTAAEVGVVIDVRQRRGVRGPDYAWANAQRLQRSLAAARIAYVHRRELAPTTELRHLQYAEDDRQGVGRRNRRVLAADYVRRYTAEVLDPVGTASIMITLPPTGTAALLCVERDSEACHRSLIAERLIKEHGVVVDHLRPD